jgi:hypothetical protein
MITPESPSRTSTVDVKEATTKGQAKGVLPLAVVRLCFIEVEL